MQAINTSLLWEVWGFAAIVMMCAWFWQIKSKNAGIVDALWALLIAVSCLYIAYFSSGEFELRFILAVIGFAWFARLGLHLLFRILSEDEDGRYRAMREHFGDKTNLFHFFFFQLQAVFVVMCVLPIWWLGHFIEVSLLLKIIAIVIAVTAFLGEHQADHQLHLWRSDPDNKGKTCRTGLWKYSRHPNYFFEWCHWLIYPILGLAMSSTVAYPTLRIRL